MTGSSGSNFLVNDPGFTKSSYTAGEVVRAGIFTRPTGCSALLSESLVAEETLDLSAVNMIAVQEVAALLEPSFLME